MKMQCTDEIKKCIKSFGHHVYLCVQQTFQSYTFLRTKDLAIEDSTIETHRIKRLLLPSKRRR